MLKRSIRNHISTTSEEDPSVSKKTIGIIVAVVVICAGVFGGWMYHSAKLDKMRSAGTKELAGIAVLDDYREEQQKEISRILEDSEAKVK